MKPLKDKWWKWKFRKKKNVASWWFEKQRRYWELKEKAENRMTSSEWKEANYLLRHLFTRVAAHGLHHRMCATKGSHSPNEGCQCTLCGGLCNIYHIIKCTRTLTLSHYVDDTSFQWYIIYTVHSVLNPLQNQPIPLLLYTIKTLQAANIGLTLRYDVYALWLSYW